jgi:hypothetical protein
MFEFMFRISSRYLLWKDSKFSKLELDAELSRSLYSRSSMFYDLFLALISLSFSSSMTTSD